MLTHLQPRTLSPKRVVILGARGFLSLHLQHALKEGGIPFVALASSETDLTKPESVGQLEAQIQPDDAVVMLSTLTPDKGRDVGTLMLNLRMGEHVCSAMRRTGCAHFVYLSSDAVYDAHQIPLDEDSTREPMDLYALTHTAREMMLTSVLDKKETPFCILRPTNIYGPGDTHFNYGPNRFVRTALKDGVITLFGNGEERRSQVYVEDAVGIIMRVLRHRSRGTLNIANRPAVTFRQIADLIIGLSGRSVRVEHVERTVPVVHRPYKPTQIARFIYNLGRPIGPIIHRTFAVSAIAEAFPDISSTPIEQGLERFVSAEKNRGGHP
jgi:UDP-glucose 4-epimerase